MTAAKDVHVGFRHGRLTVVDARFERLPSGGAKFRVRCDCGTEYAALFRGGFQSQSCGCLQRDAVRAANTTHDGATEPLYRVWVGMKTRCYNERSTEFDNYGGRGIKVCAAWRSNYGAFRSWALANGYKPGLTIDRANVNGNYSPSNCRWATRSEQARNTRRATKLRAFGEAKCVADWSDDERCVVSSKTLDSRLRRGWELQRALTTPADTRFHRTD